MDCRADPNSSDTLLWDAPGIVSVTSGNNTVSFRQGGRTRTVYGYSARSGYNLAAGLGTVNGEYFVPELAHLAG